MLKPGVSLVVRAEQALLGAVLSDPAGQGHVLDLVDADDMARPYHGQVLAAMKRLRDRGAEPEPLAVYAELANDPDLPRSVSHDGVLIADLLEASPRPGHAPAYAAMVVSSSIRRGAALAASLMAQAAESGDTESALAMAAKARRELGECRARWESLPAPVRRELPVQDLAAGPSQIGVVRDWLRPEHFADPTHGKVYALMQDMAAAGKPVDPVTVAWEADGRGLAVDVADLEGGTAAFAVPSAREVHRQGLLAEAARTGRDIQAHAAGPGPPLTAFLREPEGRLGQIQPSPQGPTAKHHRLPGRCCARAAVPRQVQPVHDTTPEATP